MRVEGYSPRAPPLPAAAALVGAEVHGEGDVAAKDHLVAVAAGELDEDVLAGDGVVGGGSYDGVGDAVEAGDGNEFGLGVEGVVDMHVGHDLVGVFDEIVGHLVGADLRQTEVGFRIDQAGIDGHALWRRRSARRRGSSLCRFRRRRRSCRRP